MQDLYETISALCAARGIRPGRMCADIGISRGAMTDLKMGRKQTLSAHTLSRIAEYLGVSIETLLGKTPAETKKASAEAEALVNGDAELTEYLEELKNREECRMLFSLAKGATKEDVLRAVAIIEALRRGEENRG